MDVLDVLTEVLSYLTPFDAGLASQVCKWWHALITKDSSVKRAIHHPGKKDKTKMKNTDKAASLGYLEVLQWARANGCDWDSDTCAFAAWGGHLEVLQWARFNGCVWDRWTCADEI